MRLPIARTTVTLVLATAAAVLLAAAGAAGAQDDLRGFQLVGDYQLFLQGQEAAGAQLYLSRTAGAFLVIADDLPSPVLLSARNQTSYKVQLLKISPTGEDTLDLLPGALFGSPMPFRQIRGGLEFAVDGVRAQLRQRPSLAGEATLETLYDHDPGYRRSANAYETDPAVVAEVADLGAGVEVRVVFGSWCHVCERFMPRGLKVHEQLQESPLRFSYYGLGDDNPWGDAEVVRFGVKELPTAIVYRDGREIGRYIGGPGWTQPEVSLRNILRENP